MKAEHTTTFEHMTAAMRTDRLAPLKPERTALAALQHNPVGILVRKRVHGTGPATRSAWKGSRLGPFLG